LGYQYDHVVMLSIISFSPMLYYNNDFFKMGDDIFTPTK